MNAAASHGSWAAMNPTLTGAGHSALRRGGGVTVPCTEGEACAPELASAGPCSVGAVPMPIANAASTVADATAPSNLSAAAAYAAQGGVIVLRV
jgi:hypothetical protein